MFIDEIDILVKAGAGGDGAVSFRREKFVPRGGPDGGDGGRGGSVYLEASYDVNTLYGFRNKHLFKAEPGGTGTGNRRHGSKGKDLVIKVPVGTIATVEGEAIVADLTVPGEREMVARGGRGGLGNIHFTTSTMQTPRIAQKGEAGGEKGLHLELRLLADVGLVGLPNAGKSTLLATVTAARPKIADYPFTTLVPNLGVVALGDSSFVAADIPGLIEGAHTGAGLGLEFLKHVRRTRLLVHLLDGSSEDPIRDYEVVNRELAEYSNELAEKPQLVAFTKMDLPESREAWPDAAGKLRAMGLDAVPISSATSEGIKELIGLVVGKLAEWKPAPAPDEGLKVYRLEGEPDSTLEVKKEDSGAFRIVGKAAERAAGLINIETPEGLMVMKKRLAHLGVAKLLEKAGAMPGDTVRVGEAEYRWEGVKR